MSIFTTIDGTELYYKTLQGDASHHETARA
jgi:hypothetical protein